LPKLIEITRLNLSQRRRPMTGSQTAGELARPFQRWTSRQPGRSLTAICFRRGAFPARPRRDANILGSGWRQPLRAQRDEGYYETLAVSLQ
jgi:hypothetical protein